MRCFSVLVCAFSALTCSCFAADSNEIDYGNAIVQKVLTVCEQGQFEFVCDIRNFPPIIGKDIAVRINGIVPCQSDCNAVDVNEVKSFVKAQLETAKRIQLSKMRRGCDFVIVADVYCDKENLAELLVRKKYARLTDGEETVNANQPILQEPNNEQFISSRNSKIFHRKSCRWTDAISDKNMEIYPTSRDALEKGKRACKTCKP